MTEAPARTSFPWLWPYGEHAAWCFHDFSNPGSVSLRLNQLLNGRALQAPLFVHSKENFGALAYEHAVRDGSIPTRDLGHDWYNGHVWLTFTAAKKALNDRHIQDSLSVERVGGNGRSRLRDALTLFDENVLLVQAPIEQWEALQQHHWHTLLVAHRQDWRPLGLQDRAPGLRPVVFGHALLEKLCQPYKAVTAHAFWVDPAVPATETAWDIWLSHRLDANFMATKPFQPLPVMGIPGWCEDNDHASFYEDAQVFRPLRRSSSAGR